LIGIIGVADDHRMLEVSAVMPLVLLVGFRPQDAATDGADDVVAGVLVPARGWRVESEGVEVLGGVGAGHNDGVLPIDQIGHELAGAEIVGFLPEFLAGLQIQSHQPLIRQDIGVLPGKGR
jgi:hypothetical protein